MPSYTVPGVLVLVPSAPVEETPPPITDFFHSTLGLQSLQDAYFETQRILEAGENAAAIVESHEVFGVRLEEETGWLAPALLYTTIWTVDGEVYETTAFQFLDLPSLPQGSPISSRFMVHLSGDPFPDTAQGWTAFLVEPLGSFLPTTGPFLPNTDIPLASLPGAVFDPGEIITGTAEEDVGALALAGTDADETLRGLEGGDVLLGSAGFDVLDGGPGDDLVSYTDGSVFSQAGVFLNTTDDVVSDDDYYFGYEVAPGRSQKQISGERYADFLISIEAFELTEKRDFAYLGDTETGGVSVFDRGGNDKVVSGGTGATALYVGAGSGEDILVGSSNPNDHVDYSAITLNGAGLEVRGIEVIAYEDAEIAEIFPGTTDFMTVGVYWREDIRETDLLERIEIITGTDLADTYQGNSYEDVFFGAAGADLFHGAGGNDESAGGAGIDTLHGDEGDDLLFGNGGNDRLFGGAGVDTLNGGVGADTLSGGADGDTLLGLDGFDLLQGQGGDDTLRGNAGNDTLEGGAGADQLEGGIGADTLNGGSEGDRLFGGDGYDDLFGGGGDDTLFGNAGNDTMSGAAGNDILQGGQGIDVLRGGDGDDLVRGQTGFDDLDGGAGNDTVQGGEGNDRVAGGAGNDTLTGGIGADVFVFTAGQDRITDLSLNVDAIALSGTALGVAGLSGADVVARTAETTAEGTVLRFETGDALTLDGITNLTRLGDLIEVI